MRAPAAGFPTVVAQYGVTATSNGLLDDILPGVEVSDAGLVAISCGDNGPLPGRFVVNDEPVRTQKRIDLHSGDLVRLELPGGGGYGRSDLLKEGEPQR